MSFACEENVEKGVSANVLDAGMRKAMALCIKFSAGTGKALVGSLH